MSIKKTVGTSLLLQFYETPFNNLWFLFTHVLSTSFSIDHTRGTGLIMFTSTSNGRHSLSVNRRLPCQGVAGCRPYTRPSSKTESAFRRRGWVFRPILTGNRPSSLVTFSFFQFDFKSPNRVDYKTIKRSLLRALFHSLWIGIIFSIHRFEGDGQLEVRMAKIDGEGGIETERRRRSVERRDGSIE